MLDENETGTSREDALNTYESLFGDTAADPAAAVAEEQEGKNKTGQEPQVSDDDEPQADPSEELKVVMSLKEGRATIGVQRPSSDPHIETFDDPDLSGLVREVPAVVERARARWEDEPKYPHHERPAPPPRRRPRRVQGSAQNSTDEGEAAQGQPQSRLF